MNTFIKLYDEILGLTNINYGEMILLSIIISLSKEKGYAFPTKKKLAEKLQCKEDTVKKMLNKLKKLEYVYTKYEKHRTEYRRFYVCDKYKHLIDSPSLQETKPSNKRKAPKWITKLIARNEILEKENEILKQKITKLENESINPTNKDK